MGCLVFVSLWPGSGSFTARLAVFSRDSHGSLPSLDTSAASHQQNTQIWPDKTGIELKYFLLVVKYFPKWISPGWVIFLAAVDSVRTQDW